jgi:hypothetical protein
VRGSSPHTSSNLRSRQGAVSKHVLGSAEFKRNEGRSGSPDAGSHTASGAYTGARMATRFTRLRSPCLRGAATALRSCSFSCIGLGAKPVSRPANPAASQTTSAPASPPSIRSRRRWGGSFDDPRHDFAAVALDETIQSSVAPRRVRGEAVCSASGISSFFFKTDLRDTRTGFVYAFANRIVYGGRC